MQQNVRIIWLIVYKGMHIGKRVVPGGAGGLTIKDDRTMRKHGSYGFLGGTFLDLLGTNPSLVLSCCMGEWGCYFALLLSCFQYWSVYTWQVLKLACQ